MKIIKLFPFCVIYFVFSFTTSCGNTDEPQNTDIVFNSNLKYGNVKDIDGNVYKTISIGTQIWMAENLKTTRYRNGDTIPNVKSNNMWDGLNTGALCTYNNTTNKDSILRFGRLYNWYALNDKRLIAPIGWHIPTDTEWQTLQDFLSIVSYNSPYGKSTEDISKSLASTSGWLASTVIASVGDNLTKNNNSGFTAMPGGFRIDYGNFREINTTCIFFGLGTNVHYSKDYFIGFSNTDSNIGIYGYGGMKQSGFSVRCVKD